MKILLINGHPDNESFCKSIYDEIRKHIDTSKHEVRTLNLADMKFDPVLRFGYRMRMEKDAEIEDSRELIKWADHYIFVYPIWWSGMPSLMKGWIDRVFTPGIAYSSNTKGNFILNYLLGRQFKKRLKGKTADIYATSMAPGWWYPIFSNLISVPDSYGIAVLKNAVLSHCGVKTKNVFVLGEMGRDANTMTVRKKYLAKVARQAQKL